MKFERHHEILKRLSKFGSVKVSDLSNSLNVTKETIRSDLNELARLGYLTRCHGGAFIVLDSLDTIAKNEIAYALENYDTAQGIKKGHSTMKSQVCVIGSFNVDIISYLPRLPTIGESLLASNFIFSPGGKGCNQALAASFADTDVYFITMHSPRVADRTICLPFTFTMRLNVPSFHFFRLPIMHNQLHWRVCWKFNT